MASAFNHEEWAARGLKDYSDYADMVTYCNQEEDGFDCQRGEWFYGDDATRTIYYGTFGNYNSPGADCYTYADDYDTEEEYRAELAKWEAMPEYLDSEDDSDE